MRRMIAVRDRPRIGISACLLGEPVRYNGGDKRDAWLVDTLGPQVEWVPVCPEVEAGFGTPREPMELVRDPRHGVVLMTTRARVDLTTALREFAERRVAELAALDLDGYVLKAGSPSCAISTKINENALVTEPAGSRAASSADSVRPAVGLTGSGPGLFAAVLMRRLPDLPVADEQQLTNAELRHRFVGRVFARARADKIAR